MNALTVKSEDTPKYTVITPSADNDDAIIGLAMDILAKRITERNAFSSPSAVREYLALRAAQERDQHIERFAVMFLDSQNRLIDTETMFNGTLTQTSVYPREVVRAALRHNAAAVILTHNHPSGSVQPSLADETMTQTLKAALALVDVRVLDHIITANGQTLSMAEKSLV